MNSPEPTATGRLTRNPAVVARELDDAVFLVSPQDDAVFHLNATGAAVWRLLAEPLSVAEAVEVITSGFPDIPADRVRTDVEQLFEELRAGGFVVPVG